MDRNNFDNVRIGLALIVVFAHVATLTQFPEFQIFRYVFDSKFAVKSFFAISGFLVTKSYLSSSTTFEYMEKRIRRIYPAYIAVIVLCMLIGLFASTLEATDFFSNVQTLKYFLANIIFLNFLQPTLPGVFEANPTPHLNGSLWTIKVEVMLYACVPFIVFLYRRIGTTISAIGLIGFSIAWAYFFTFIYSGTIGPEISRQFPGQLSFFAFGSYLAVNIKALRQVKWLALASFFALFLTNNQVVRLFLDPIAYTSIVILLCTLKFSKANLGRFGDISYGIYLYHFPVIQFLIYIGIFAIPWLGFAITFFLTIALSLLSWHLLEKRFLTRSSHYRLASESQS